MNHYALYEHRFRAMNTDVGVWLWSTPPQVEDRLWAVENRFAAVEDTFSRFRPQSELSRLNAAAGQRAVNVSSSLWQVLSLALRHAEESTDIFDPTVLGDLMWAGYDRSFEEGLDAPAQPSTAESTPGQATWRQIHLQEEERSVCLPLGIGIDLGGIAKGWTVDEAALALGQWGPALVDAGGDIRVTAAVEGEPWPIALQDPFDPARNLLVLRISEGAVATSSIGKRCWQRAGKMQHHLIDPRTRRPAESDLHTVTVLAPTAVVAEISAKVVLILGRQAGADYLDAHRLTGILFTRDGQQERIGDLPIEIEQRNLS